MIPAERKLLNALLADDRLPDPRWAAYIMATVAHETNQTFEPVEEAYWMPDDWRQKNLRYWPYYGRGFVQITWKENYERMGARIGNPNLVFYPSIATNWEIAYEILVVGMVEGLFTGKDLDDFINDHHCDYKRARRIVNGMDKAGMIAIYAVDYEDLINEYKRDEPARPVLRQGDKGKEVAEVQDAIGKWVNATFRTGLFNAFTEDAIRHFQREHCLTVDGIVGEKTWAAMEQYL